MITAAVLKSDPVVPWYTNPAPWHIFRFPCGALSTSPRTADAFPLQEWWISHVFLLIHLSSVTTEKNNANTKCFGLADMVSWKNGNYFSDCLGDMRMRGHNQGQYISRSRILQQ